MAASSLRGRRPAARTGGREIEIGLLGSTGAMGRRVADALAARGARVGGEAVPTQIDATGATAPEDLFPRDRDRRVVDLSIATPRGSALTRAAEASGGHVVAGGGWAFALGDLLGAVAASYLLDPVEAHVTYWVPGRRGVLGGATPGERRDARSALARTGTSLREGEPEVDRIGELRRLAWFPRPVGPHHAASVPGLEWRTLPQHVPGLRTVRTYAAVRSWVAEVMQGLGNASRLDGAGRRVAVPARDVDRSDPAERWAVVAELQEQSGRVSRTWAYGTDRHGLAAEVAVSLALRLREVDAPPGLVAPSRLVDARVLLDELAGGTDLRWSATAAGT